VNRQYLISTIRSYREKLTGLGLKASADAADDLLDELLDIGREWQRMVPRVHSLVDYCPSS
jgi:hypothetical protein